VDVVAQTNKPTSKDALNDLYRRYSSGRMKGILGVTDEPLVSTDYRGDPRSSIVDSLSTMVIGDTLVKVVAWYDNEWGYANRLADVAAFVLEKEG
jgi:glyceraldehyde 3-phosphate dehydrogenase